MMNIEERWQTERQQGIEETLKIARDELIRKKAMTVIFNNTTKELVHIAYNSEKQEAFEVIMDDAHSYLKTLNNQQSQILSLIYPDIFSNHFYPEQRDRAVQAALRACIMKLNQDSFIGELMG